MNAVYSIIIKLCVLFIVMALVEILVEGSKCARYVKSVISVLLIIAIIEFIINADFEIVFPEIADCDMTEKSVWDNTKEFAQQELQNKLIELCYSNGIVIENIDVELSTDYHNYNIERIVVSGQNALKAKKFLSGYLNLGLAYIDIGE